MKKASKRALLRTKVKNGVKEKNAVELEKMNKMGKLLSPDLEFQMTMLPALTVWIAQRWAGRSATKGAL
jgi:hypothetical protein